MLIILSLCLFITYKQFEYLLFASGMFIFCISNGILIYDTFIIQIKHEEPLKGELKSFLNAVATNTEPEITGEDGLKALKMVIAANKSSKEHKPISFDEL